MRKVTFFVHSLLSTSTAIVIVIVAFCLASSTARGQVTVSQSTGSAVTSIPIKMPTYHGLEPAVLLSYNSSGGNGILGVGWSLSGFPFIEGTAV